MTIPQRSYDAPQAIPSTSHGTTNAGNNMMQIPVSLDNTPLDLYVTSLLSILYQTHGDWVIYHVLSNIIL